MNREYPLTGTKIIMRRLFLPDMDAILNCYSQYDNLFFNPVDRQFIENVFLHGELWGAFLQDKLLACCYYFPLASSFFSQCNTFEQLTDFISNPESWLNMGYIGINSDGQDFIRSCEKENPAHSGLYQAFLNIAEMQAFRRGFRHVLHYIPLKLADDISVITDCGYHLIKTRGLDKLVVHYIFAKAVFYENDISSSRDCVLPLSDTKALSFLLENGWYGYKVFNDGDVAKIAVKKSVAD